MEVPCQDRGRRTRAPTRQPREAVGGIAHQRQVVGDGCRRHTELLLHRGGVVEATLSPVEGDHAAVGANALCHVLVRAQDDHALHLGVVGKPCRGRGQPIVGLELEHGPDHHAESPQRIFDELELRQQLWRHPRLRLVAGVTIVAPGADDMVGGAAEVRDTVIGQQRQHRLHHAQRRADRLAIEAAVRRSPEVRAEELVGGVQQVDLHGCCRGPGGADRQVRCRLLAAPDSLCRADLLAAASSWAARPAA